MNPQINPNSPGVSISPVGTEGIDSTQPSSVGHVKTASPGIQDQLYSSKTVAAGQSNNLAQVKQSMGLPSIDPPMNVAGQGTTPKAAELLGKCKILSDFVNENNVGNENEGAKESGAGNVNFGPNIRTEIQIAVRKQQKMLSSMALMENRRAVKETEIELDRLISLVDSMKKVAEISSGAEKTKAITSLTAAITTGVTAGVQLGLTANIQKSGTKKMEEEIKASEALTKNQPSRTVLGADGTPTNIDAIPASKTVAQHEADVKDITKKAHKQIGAGIESIRENLRAFSSMTESVKQTADHFIDSKKILEESNENQAQELLRAQRDQSQRRADSALQMEKSARQTLEGMAQFEKDSSASQAQIGRG